MKRSYIIAGAVILAVILTGAAYVCFGAYNVAADVPHTRLVHGFINYARDRSIEVRAAGIRVPDLNDPRRITAGAAEYAEMCSGCHLAPGMEKTEISLGLYPQPPELSHGTDLSPAEEFWVVKHGIKLTGMPAWGRTHDDDLLWDIVAFVRKLPALTPAQYQAMTKNAPETHEEMMHGETMPGMHPDAGHDDHH